VVGKEVGGIQRRHERERPLGRIALALVVDVVEDQAVQPNRAQSRDGRLGDLLRTLAIGVVPRWCQCEKQKLALTDFDALDEIHRREGTAVSCTAASDEKQK
jgi:hypothetical protein